MIFDPIKCSPSGPKGLQMLFKVSRRVSDNLESTVFEVFSFMNFYRNPGARWLSLRCLCVDDLHAFGPTPNELGLHCIHLESP